VALVIVVGVAGGTALALAVTRSVQTLLFGVDAADPAVFSLAAGVVAIVTLAAAWIPARRASRVDPTTALR
jgi:putative ABC transport system permease protein